MHFMCRLHHSFVLKCKDKYLFIDIHLCIIQPVYIRHINDNFG